jgi:hypothetical protein
MTDKERTHTLSPTFRAVRLGHNDSGLDHFEMISNVGLNKRPPLVDDEMCSHAAVANMKPMPMMLGNIWAYPHLPTRRSPGSKC